MKNKKGMLVFPSKRREVLDLLRGLEDIFILDG
jgi:hypothetical protein